MIKYLIIILILLSANTIKAQLPSGFPTQANTGWTQWGYQQSTLGTIVAVRDTLWTPRFCGTMVLWPHAGVDTAYWMWDCSKWKKISTSSDIVAPAWGNITGTLSNQTDLQNALNLKFNISDTANKWVQNVYARNDSIFKLKNGTESLITAILNNSLNNIGDGFRWLATPNGDFKSVVSSNTIIWDSTSNANALTAKADTSVLATQFDISQFSSGSGAENQITYWTGTYTIGGDAGMTVIPLSNTIISDTNRLKRANVVGDSTNSNKIVFYPSKTKTGSISASIGYGEANNEYDLDSTVNNTLEGRIGGVDGASGPYIRWGMEKRWKPFPGSSHYWQESHPIEVRTTEDEIYRPISYTGQENGDESVMSIRGKTIKFHDLETEKGTGGFTRSSGGITPYHNYSGTGVVYNTVLDSGTLANVAGFTITGQVSGGLRTSTTQHHGQNITHTFERGPVYRSTTGSGGDINGWNFMFNIPAANTNHPLIITKGDGLFDNVYLWIHNDGRVVSGDAGFFFSGYKFQAKPQGSMKAFMAGDYDASNNTILYTSSFGHSLTSGSGSGASGMGAGFDFVADNTANTVTSIADIAAVWNATPTAGAESGDLVFRNTRLGTKTEGFRILSTGAARFNNAFTFPTADGTNGQVLQTNGSGIVTWQTPSAATTIYTGDGTITGGNRTVNTGGNTITVTGTNDSETSFSVVNTGTTNANAISGSTTGATSIGVSGSSSAYIGVYGSSTTNNGVQGESSSGTGVVGVSATGAAFRGQINPSANNTIENIVTLLRTTSSGAGANNIGTAIQYELETATNGTSQIAGSIAFKWTDATNLTRTSQAEIYAVNSATTARKAALAGSGQWTWDGYGAGTFTGTPTGTIQVTSAGAVIEGPIVAAGLYTPTLTAVSNTSSPLLDGARYNRVGNVVTFSLRFSVTTSSGSTASSIRVTLPISSAFNNVNNAAGTSSGSLGSVEADAANDELTISWISGSGGSETITVSGQYTIL